MVDVKILKVEVIKNRFSRNRFQWQQNIAEHDKPTTRSEFALILIDGTREVVHVLPRVRFLRGKGVMEIFVEYVLHERVRHFTSPDFIILVLSKLRLGMSNNGKVDFDNLSVL